jgi:hypothetical protein
MLGTGSVGPVQPWKVRTTMNTPARCALGLLLVGACAPGELRQDEPPPSTQASAYWVAPTCGPAKVGAVRELLPDGPLVGAMEVDMQGLQRSALFRDNKSALTAELSDVLDGMKACGVPLSKVERVTAGFSMSDDVVLGVKARGLATGKTLDCLSRKIESKSGTRPWTRTTSGCVTTLDIDGGDAKGFAVGRDMLVVASKSVADEVQRRIDGKDKSVLDGKLSWARREVDMGATAWVATNVPAGLSAGLSSSMSGMSHVGMSMDTTKGVGLEASVGFASSKNAKAAEAELSTMVVQARAMMPLVGLPSSVADTITLSSSGAVVKMGVSLSDSDVEALRRALDPSSGGSSGGSPPPRKGM